MLRRAAGRGETWAWAWNDLMWSEARADDSVRFRCYLARQIAKLPPSVVHANLRAIVQWFTGHTKPVWESDRALYLTTWQFLVAAIARAPEAASSAVVVKGRHDWITEAINSPAGRLADQLFDELGWAEGPHHPDDSLRDRALGLLALPPGPRALAAVMLAMRTNWFYAHDRDWAEAHLVPVIEDGSNADVADAVRTGFLRQSNFPANELYLRLAPMLLAMFVDARRPPNDRDDRGGAAGSRDDR